MSDEVTVRPRPDPVVAALARLVRSAQERRAKLTVVTTKDRAA